MKVFGKNGIDANRNEGAPSPNPAPRPAPVPAPAPPPPAAATEASVVNSGLKVIGNMESDGDIVVAGTVEGDIASASLTVGEGARVKGALAVGAATIRGRVEGEIRTRSIRIAATGEVSGDIRYETMAIEEGARIDGNVGMIDSGAASARAARPAGTGAGSGARADAGGAAAKPAARAKA